MNKEQMYKYLITKFMNEGKKVEILKELQNNNFDYELLVNKLKISTPLLSYYMNGNLKAKGLIELGMVNKKFVSDKKTDFYFEITDFGKSVLKDIK